MTAGLNDGTVRLLWRVAEFLSEEKSDRFNNNLGVYRDNSAENIPEKVGLRIM